MPGTIIAIVSPGDMGSAVGRVLGAHGYTVITCLAGRSKRTEELARNAHIQSVATLEELVTQADLVLSIVAPAEAVNVAEAIVGAAQAANTRVVYADCNAIAPQTAQRIESLISGAGGLFIDAGIIGGPPREGGSPPRFYVSGPQARILHELDGKGILVRNVGDEVGRASAIKMTYAALTKGTTALQAAVLTAAESLGVSVELQALLAEGQGEMLKQMEGIQRTPTVAGRWIGEMEEIAATFAAVGVTPDFHRGAAEVYRLAARTSFAKDTPEMKNPKRTTAAIVAEMAKLSNHARR